MFGHDDKQKDEEKNDEVTAVESQTVNPDNTDAAQSDSGADEWQHPGPPPSDDNDDAPSNNFSAGHKVEDEGDNLDTSANAPADPEHTAHLDFDASPATPTNHGQDELIDIKQEALGKLTPLIGHLDQTPDEKFRTLMMMIQASDDQSLVRQAYDTALEIEDEKTRAQALLDIVNEINYFTQNPKSE